MDKLRDRYKQLLTPIQQGLSSLNRPRRNISNNSGLVQQAYRSKVGQQVAQVRLPGSGRTLEQGVRHNIQNANLVKNLASGRYFSGSVPQAKSLDRYIAQPTGQALNVVGEGLTATLANFGVKKAETLPERIGQGVGVVAAIPALLATGGGATGQVSKYAEMLVRPAATTGRLSRIAPAIAGELAQTGSLLAGKKALGQEFDPKTDLLFGLGGRGAFGALGTLSRVPSDAGMDEIIKRGKALGIKGISPRANNIHAEDYDFMHQFNDRVTALPKGATMTDRDPFLKQAQELAGHYFGKQWAKADSKTLKKLFDWGIDLTDHLPRDQRAQLPDLPGSKLVNNLIGDDVARAAHLSQDVKSSASSKALFNEARRYKSANAFENAVFGGRIGPSKLKALGFEVHEGSRLMPGSIKFPEGYQTPDGLIDIWNKATRAGAEGLSQTSSLNATSLNSILNHYKSWGGRVVDMESVKNAYKYDPEALKQIKEAENEVLRNNANRQKINVEQERVNKMFSDAKTVGDIRRASDKQKELNRLRHSLGMNEPIVVRKDTSAIRPVTPPPTAPPTSPPTIKPPSYGKRAGNINLVRMNIDPKAKARLSKEVELAKGEIQEAVGKRLTNAEVLDAARTANVLKKVVSRADTEQFAAGLLKLRQAVAAGAEGKGVTQEFLDSLRALSTQAADTGRRLQSFAIQADPALDSTKAQMVARLQKLGVQSEDILKRAEGVDFNDNRQAVEFYRSFVKPSIGEILEEYRYMNLLSSPRTHIVNVFSNAIQATLTRPATKLAEAAIDPVVAALSGRKREVYLKEVPLYYRGMFGAVPDAFTKLRDVFSGKQAFTNLDMDHIPTGSLLSKGNVITKSLEGMDQFYQTLIRGGEATALRSRGTLSEKEILKRANELGEYTVFRQGLSPQGQGPVLNWVDQGTAAVMQLRRVPGMGWFIPFIQTPMNIFKQGIEYSPLGAATALKSGKPTEQLAKSAIGSMVFTGAGYLALQDRLSWKAPRDPEQKKAFYAAGMQPYAVKMGDKWISFSKIGPLAYPLALAAAIKYSFEDDPEAAASGTLEKLGDSLAGIVGFFGDQSYMQGIGDLVNAVQGQEGYKSTFATAAGNVATQYIPVSSFQRWVNNIIDPIYRKGDTVWDNMQKSIVFRSDNIEGYYEDPYGEPSKRQFPGINAFSPMSVTKEDPEFMEMYDLRQEKLEGNALIRKMKEEVEQEKEVKANRAEASEEFSQGETGADDPKELQRIKIKQEIARESVRLKGGVQEAGGVAYYTNDEGGVSSLNLGKFSKPATGIKALELEGEKQSTARKIVAEDAFDDKRKDRYLKALGITREDAEYDYYATRENDVKSQLMASTLANMGREQMFTTLVEGRKQSLSGKRYVSDGVIDDLVDEGLLTYAEGKALKKVKPETGATTTGAASTSKGGGKKGKTNRDITIPKGSRSISSGKVKVKQVRSQAPKLKRVTLRSKGSSVPRVTPVKKKRSAAAAIRATQLRS